MANIKRPVTSFGWEVKKRLADLQMTQKEFCEEHKILVQRFSDVITGARPAKKEKKYIAHVLGIADECATQVKKAE